MNDYKYVDLAQGLPQGDILHSPSTANGPTTNDLVYRQKPENTTGGASSSKSYGEYNPPRGEMGWICPVCGRGLAPSTSYCPCNLTRNITYGGLSLQDMAINCNSTPPKAYYTAIETNIPNGEDWIKADEKLHCPVEH